MPLRLHSRKYRLLHFIALIFFLTCLTLFSNYQHKAQQMRPLSTVQHIGIKEFVDNALDEFISGMVPGEKLSGSSLHHISEVQDYLGCMIQKADWQTTTQDPYLALNTNCQIPGQSVSLPFNLNICDLVSGQKVLLVGSETTYHLHSLWLQILEAREHQTHQCPGRDYCTFHHICMQNGTLPPSPGTIATRKKKMPSETFLRETGSALLQYTHSSTLYSSPKRSDVGYQYPIVNDETDIKQSDSFWYGRAQKSDILLLNRAPEPAPAASYNSDLKVSGNWSFASRACEDSAHFSDFACGGSLADDLAMAALDITIARFLPPVLETFRRLAADVTLRNSRLIWQGSWFVQTSCSRIGNPRIIPLLEGFWFKPGAVETAMDPWTFYYNAQVYMHNRLLPKIAPYFNITYLPLGFPMFDETTDVYIEGQDESSLSHRTKDCIRRPWPRFGADLSQAFEAGLSALLTLHNHI